jgi:plasmid stabilization system protein ParE
LGRYTPSACMTVEFHPTVQSDFNRALDHYEVEGGPHLAERFEGEFRACIAAIQAAPRQFSLYRKSEIFRRIRLENFPYIVVYREKADVVRVIVLKYERRHPRFGMSRR